MIELSRADIEVEGGLQSLAELNTAEVVRSEFLSPKFKPNVTFDYDKIVFNAACVRLMEDTEYVLLLVDRARKRLIVLPDDEYTKDAIKWSKTISGKKQPRQSLCKVFGAKLFELMNWIPGNRYKVQAVYQVIDNQRLIVFNLDECEMVVPELITKPDGKTIKKRYYPQEWRESFGVIFSEHRDTYKIDLDAHYMLNITKDGEERILTIANRGRVPAAAEIITRPYTKTGEGGDSKNGE